MPKFLCRIAGSHAGPILQAVMLLCLAAANPANAATKLIVQMGAPADNLSYDDIYVAERTGFFKEEGLDVTWRHAANASQAAQIVASGGADIARLTYEPLILGYDKGIRGKIFYNFYTRLIYFAGIPEDSPIKSIADLKGKRLGVSNMGSSSILVLKSMLNGAGLTPGDVTLVPVGTGDTAVAALRSRQVDAFMLWDAIYAAIESVGVKLRYIQDPTAGDVGDGGYFTNGQALAQKHAALAGFARALAKSTAFIFANPEAAVRIFWQIDPAGKVGTSDAEAMQRTLTALRFAMQSWDVGKLPGGRYGAIDLPKFQSYIDMIRQQGAIPQPVPASEIVTNEFVDAANDFDGAQVRAMAMSWK